MKQSILNNRKQAVLIIYILAFVLIVSLVFSGCAYFNSFYNTNRYFKEAERERMRTTDLNAKPAGYTKAVESGGRLLEYFPNSKYVEQTLLIMGQSYYWTEEYHKAKRKFEELETNYRESEYLDEARLWIGKTLVRMKNRQKATSTLRGLLADTDDPELTSGALFALAELYFVDSLFNKAEEEFLNITLSTEDSEVLGEALWRAGEAAFREKKYPQTVEHLEAALKQELPRTMRFKTTFFLGRALYEIREYDKAINTFSKVLKDKRYFEQHGAVRVYLALSKDAIGDSVETADQLQRVIENHPRTPEASQAYYERAIISLRDGGDRELAKEDLDKARVEKAKSEFAQRADTLLTIINRVDQLGEQRRITQLRIQFTEQWAENPINPEDSSDFVSTAYYDSLAIDSLFLSSLWKRAWRDSIPPIEQVSPVAPVEDDSISQVDSVSAVIPDIDSEIQVLEDKVAADTSIATDPEIEAPEVVDQDPTLIHPDETMEAVSDTGVTVDLYDMIMSRGRGKEKPEEDKSESIPLEFMQGGKPPEMADSDSTLLSAENGDSTLLISAQPQLADSSNLIEDSLQVSLSPDSLGQDSTAKVSKGKAEPPPMPEPIVIFDPAPVYDSLAVMRVQLQDMRFQLAEILLFDLNEPDSARIVFSELANPENADSVRSKAILALSNIAGDELRTTDKDSLLNMLINEFAGSEISLEAATRLGIELEKPPLQPDEIAFLQAESLFLAGKDFGADAYGLYRWIFETYPNSVLAPQAMWASAYISGNYLGDSETTEELLNDLQAEYPSSEQAVEAGRKLSALQSSRTRAAGGGEIELEATEEELLAHGEDELDITPELIGGQSTLANILEMRGLLPQEVISGTGGDVKLRYLISSEGVAYNFRIVFETPPGMGLARALIAALEEVTFRPGSIDGEYVDVRLERTYTLPLDAPPNVRPLPRRI